VAAIREAFTEEAEVAVDIFDYRRDEFTFKSRLRKK